VKQLKHKVRMLTSPTQAAPVQVQQRTRGTTWQRIRERILARDKGLCQCDVCKASGRVLPAQEVDHIRPLHQGGTDADDNLQAINAECHKRKSEAEGAARARGLAL
jgi:5-methylcytosine-specific restriction protein A